MAIATLALTFLFPPAFLIFIPTFYHASQYVVVTLAYYLKERRAAARCFIRQSFNHAEKRSGP